MANNTLLTIIAIFHSLSVIASICGAAWLSANGKDGWGWFLFVALCLGSVSIKLES